MTRQEVFWFRVLLWTSVPPMLLSSAALVAIVGYAVWGWLS